MAITLVEAAKLYTGNVLRMGVIEMFAANSDLLAVFPFETIAGNAYQYNRESELPGVAFRGVNESYTASTGIVNPLVEALKIAGGDLDVDNFITRTQGEGVRATHEAMKIKALSLTLTKKFIKGDNSSEPREFDGLQTRITGTQLIENGTTDGGDVLSLGKLDAAIDAVDNPQYLLMSKGMRRIVTAASRLATVGGYVTYTKDNFGDTQTVYNDLPILISGRDEAGDEILAFDEVGTGGATATAQSIYVLSFGDGEVTGLQSGDMVVTDLGEQDTSPVKRTRVEWGVTMAILNGRAAARLRGIKTGAAAV